jgi:hypothetical protein
MLAELPPSPRRTSGGHDAPSRTSMHPWGRP